MAPRGTRNPREVGRCPRLLRARPRRDMPADRLSYGEQRRLEIASALAAEPKVLLLDEPAAGMNPEERERLVDIIKDIRKRGVTVLLVEHDMASL